MPRGDQTGPTGQGPMTGRGLGICSGSATPGFVNQGIGLAGRTRNPQSANVGLNRSTAVSGSRSAGGGGKRGRGGSRRGRRGGKGFGRPKGGRGRGQGRGRGRRR
ncbi:MAG: DUF5320 domain-containing protein [Promethearchaeia archaeon]